MTPLPLPGSTLNDYTVILKPSLTPTGLIFQPLVICIIQTTRLMIVFAILICLGGLFMKSAVNNTLLGRFR